MRLARGCVQFWLTFEWADSNDIMTEKEEEVHNQQSEDSNDKEAKDTSGLVFAS